MCVLVSVQYSAISLSPSTSSPPSNSSHNKAVLLSGWLPPCLYTDIRYLMSADSPTDCDPPKKKESKKPYQPIVAQKTDRTVERGGLKLEREKKRERKSKREVKGEREGREREKERENRIEKKKGKTSSWLV